MKKMNTNTNTNTNTVAQVQMPANTDNNFFDHVSRRNFLSTSGKVALTGAVAPAMVNLAAVADAAAFATHDGSYKALVCVFMYGGNDYANTVVTYDDASYNKYSAIRGGGPNQTAGGIALAKASLTATLLKPKRSLANGREYALHPMMGALAELFNSGKAAVQLNVGSLVKPTTRTQFKDSNRSINPLPPKLFSHNDQQNFWQTFGVEGTTLGWGGNSMDLAVASGLSKSSIYNAISLAGNVPFTAGSNTLGYQVSTNGAIKINAISSPTYYGKRRYTAPAVQAVLARFTQDQRGHVLENEYNKVVKRSVAAEGVLNKVLATGNGTGSTSAFAPFVAIPATNLANQLKEVARIIASKDSLGIKRQVFFVSIGGFDGHDRLLASHNALLKDVSDSIAAFYKTTANLGVDKNVTTFTASDFGRTLVSNGDGSDHGWGSHHFVVGGAVDGQAFYGTPPPVSVGENENDPNDQYNAGKGSLIPTTSIDQYTASLARWFGVDEREIDRIFPNLKNFNGGVLNGLPYPRYQDFLPNPFELFL